MSWKDKKDGKGDKALDDFFRLLSLFFFSLSLPFISFSFYFLRILSLSLLISFHSVSLLVCKSVSVYLCGAAFSRLPLPSFAVLHSERQVISGNQFNLVYSRASDLYSFSSSYSSSSWSSCDCILYSVFTSTIHMHPTSHPALLQYPVSSI